MNVNVKTAPDLGVDPYRGDYTWIVTEGFLNVWTMKDGKRDAVYAVYPPGQWLRVAHFEDKA